MHRILITGPTGKIGKPLLTEILNLNKEFKIRVLSLRTKKDKKFLREYEGKIEVIWGTITEIDAIKKAVKDVDVIIHLAGLVPPAVDPDSPLIEEVNFGGTKLLVEEFSKENERGVFVFLSSVAIYGRRVENPEIKITDPINPNDFYGMAKLKAEEVIKNSKLNYIIFRLGAVLSTDEELNSLIFLQPLETSLEVICIQDAVFLIARSIDCNTLYKGIYNIGGGEKCRIKYKQLLNNIFKILGLGENLLPEEAFATKTMGHNGFFIFGDRNPVEDLIHYQRYTLEDYYRKKEKAVSIGKKVLVKLFKPMVKRKLLNISEPYQALKKGDKTLIDYYF